ncbi:MAG TPA: hypothetical protein VKW09_12390 [bacterium]|nr:hypothetical protein [bacterium]
MDWIERLLHVSPDGGNGSLEVGIVAGAAVALAMILAGALKLRLWMQRRLAAGASAARDAQPGR